MCPYVRLFSCLLLSTIYPGFRHGYQLLRREEKCPFFLLPLLRYLHLSWRIARHAQECWTWFPCSTNRVGCRTSSGSPAICFAPPTLSSFPFPRPLCLLSPYQQLPICSRLTTKPFSTPRRLSNLSNQLDMVPLELYGKL